MLRTIAAVGAVSCAVLAGCASTSGTGRGAPVSSLSASTSASSAVAPSPAPDPSATTTTLTCDDAGSAATPPGTDDLIANGLTFSGTSGVVGRPTFELTKNSAAHPFQKVFLYVSLDAAPQTRFTITGPPDAYLYYVSESTWQSRQTDAHVLSAFTKSVTVSRCKSDLTGYFGGIVLGSGPCVTLRVDPLPAGTSTTLTVQLPGPC